MTNYAEPAESAAPASSRWSSNARGGDHWWYVGLTASLVVRLSLLRFESDDYRAFFGRWYDFIIDHGRWSSLGMDFSSYPPLYLTVLSLATWLPIPKLYAIKAIPIPFDYLAAWFVYKIVKLRYRDGPLPIAAATLILFWPTVILNSAVWGQCDAMYCCGFLAAYYAVLLNRFGLAMLAFGVATALKPQSIFLAPFLYGLLLNGQLPVKSMAVVPLVYLICGLPAILAGRSAIDVSIHWFQRHNLPGLTLGATNWYQWISDDVYGLFYGTGIVMAALSSCCLACVMQRLTVLGCKELLVQFAMLSVLIVPYFLPGMHERYFYPADVFSLLYSFFVRRGWIVAVLVEFASLFTYLPYLFRFEPVPRPLLAVLMSAAIGLVAANLTKSLSKELAPC